jgi:hypothetical protein
MHPAVFLRLALHIAHKGNRKSGQATRDNENEGIVYLSVVNPFLGRRKSNASVALIPNGAAEVRGGPGGGSGAAPGWVRAGWAVRGGPAIGWEARAGRPGGTPYVIGKLHYCTPFDPGSSVRSPCGLLRSRHPMQCQVPMQSTCGFRSRTSIARDPPTIRHEQNEELLSNANAHSIARHLPADRGERGARRRDRVSCVVSFASNGLLRLSVREFQGARKAQSKLSRAHTAGGNTHTAKQHAEAPRLT